MFFFKCPLCCQQYATFMLSYFSLSVLSAAVLYKHISVTAPSSLPTWHITVGAGRDVARRAAAGLGGHTAGHRVQDQDDGVDEGRVRADQPMKRTDVNPNRRPPTAALMYDIRDESKEKAALTRPACWGL